MQNIRKYIHSSIMICFVTACVAGCSNIQKTETPPPAANIKSTGNIEPQLSPQEAKKLHDQMFARQGEYWKKKAKELEKKK